tara:strand:- start:538 stop:726 length:189 start_codon:yes stop_codon:yes gene_type:complete
MATARIIDGKVFLVRKISDDSAKIAKAASPARLMAKRQGRHVSDIVSPLGIRSNSRVAGDIR